MNIYVGNLSYGLTEEALRAAFAAHGQVDSARIIKDRETGQSKGFGFVEMSTEAEAQAAISKLNDQSFEGRKLLVNVAKSPGPGSGARSGGSGGPRRTARW